MYDENVNVRIMIIKTFNHLCIFVRWITFFKTNNYVGIEEREQFGKVPKNKCKLNGFLHVFLFVSRHRIYVFSCN